MGDDCSHQACRSSCSTAIGRCLQRNTIEKVEQATRSEVGVKFNSGGKTTTSGRAWQISCLVTPEQQQIPLTSLWWSPSAPWRISVHASCYGRARQSHCFFHPVDKLEEKRLSTTTVDRSPTTITSWSRWIVPRRPCPAAPSLSVCCPAASAAASGQPCSSLPCAQRIIAKRKTSLGLRRKRKQATPQWDLSVSVCFCVTMPLRSGARLQRRFKKCKCTSE